MLNRQKVGAYCLYIVSLAKNTATDPLFWLDTFSPKPITMLSIFSSLYSMLLWLLSGFFTADLSSTSSVNDSKSSISAPCATCVQVHTIQGLWVGGFSATAQPHVGSNFYSLTIYPDGSIVTRCKGSDGKFYYASGTWTVSGKNVFSAELISIVTPGPNPTSQKLSGTYHPENGELTDCFWEDTKNTNGMPLSGPFHVKEVDAQSVECFY